MSDAVIAIWCEEQLKLALRNLKHQAWDFPYSLLSYTPVSHEMGTKMGVHLQ